MDLHVKTEATHMFIQLTGNIVTEPVMGAHWIPFRCEHQKRLMTSTSYDHKNCFSRLAIVHRREEKNAVWK